MPDLQLLLDRLGLSQRGAARLLGRSDRNVRRWVAENPPPDVVPLLTLAGELSSLTGEPVRGIIGRLYGTSYEPPKQGRPRKELQG